MPLTVNFSLVSLFQQVGASVVGHFRQFFRVLDPVKDLPSKSNKNHPHRSSRFNSFCVFPLLIFGYIYLDSVYQLWENGSFHYQPNSMPTLFTHRIYPKGLWAITDIMMVVGMWMPTITFACLLLDRMDKYRKFFMYTDDSKPVDASNATQVTQNGRALHKKEGAKIAALHKLVKKGLPLVSLPLFSLLCIFCLYHFLPNWSHLNWHDYALLAAFFPFMFYVVISNCLLMVYFCVSAKYLSIKQKGRAAAFDELSRSLMNRNRPSRQPWRVFRRLNGEVFRLHDEIRAHNSFWGVYLSVYFLGYTILVCYFTYTFLYLGESLGWMKHFFSFFAFEYFAVLLYVTLQCSKIVRRNVLLYQKSQHIGLCLKQQQQQTKVSTVEMLKIDQMVANGKNIEKVSFQLITGHPINSRMFELLFSYISIIFMMVFKDQEKVKKEESL